MFFHRPLRRFIGGVMIGGAVVCAIIAIASALLGWYSIDTAARADGRIMQMAEQQGDDGTLYAPVFSFHDAQGAEHTVQSSTASYPPRHHVGDTVRVLYLPEHPRDAKVENFPSLWGLPFITGMLAAFYLPFGLLVWYWPRIVQRFR